MTIDLTLPDVYHHMPSFNPNYKPEHSFKAEAPNAGPYDPYPNIPNYMHLYDAKPKAEAIVPSPNPNCTCGAAGAAKH